MKRFIGLLLFLTIIVSAQGQNAYGRYSSRITSDGTCYFFREVKLNKVEFIKAFKYDMTYLTWTDSTTLNFSIYSKVPASPSKLIIKSQNDSCVCDSLECFFIDAEKKGFQIRMSAKVPNEFVRKFIKSTISPVFQFTLENNNCSASYSESSWKKDSQKLQSVIQLIDLTR